MELYGEDFQSEMLQVSYLRWEPFSGSAEIQLNIIGSTLLEFVSDTIDYLVTIHGNAQYTFFFFDSNGILQKPPIKYDLSTSPLVSVKYNFVLLRPMEQQDSTTLVPDIRYIKIEE